MKEMTKSELTKLVQTITEKVANENSQFYAKCIHEQLKNVQNKEDIASALSLLYAVQHVNNGEVIAEVLSQILYE